MQIFTPTNVHRSNCFLFLLFCLILFVSYSNSFHASWQLDDKPNILKNHPIQLGELSLSKLFQAAHAKPGSGGLYRPVACITLALNWFFGQDNVLGYHIVNFIIHCCTAWVLFLTIKIVFSTPRLQGRYPPGQIVFIAVTASLFWALNPIHVQAVTYIVQRMTSMAALFSILSIYCYLSARLHKKSIKQSVLYILAIISYLLAIFSKENAAAIIFTFPLFELLFFQHTLSRHLVKKLVGGIILGIIISALCAFALRPEMFHVLFNYYDIRPFTFTERILTEQRIVLFYLSQLFFPAPGRLSVEHDIVLSTSLISPWTTLAAIIMNGLFVLLAIKFARKQPLLSLAILFYYINHLIESTIIPLELIFEHRNYLPSLFLFVPVALVLRNAISRLQHSKIAALSIIGVITLIFTAEGYATYERNKAWQTEESLWLDALTKAPNSARPLAALAIKLAWGPNPTEAKYRKALELTERTLTKRMGRIRLDAAQLGNMASIHSKLGEHKEAVTYYKKALALAPEDANIRYNYSKTLIMTGKFSQAEDEILTILNEGFVHADYFNTLGFIYLWNDYPEQALPILQQAAKYAPGHPDILLTLGKCFSVLGDYDKAKWFFSLTRKNGKDDPIVSLSMIENYLLAGRTDQARNELHRSIKRFSLGTFLQPLHSPLETRNRAVPLSNEILIPFVQSELPKITDALLQ